MWCEPKLLVDLVDTWFVMTQLSIIFLGTGGSWPTVKRNVTSVAVKRGSEVILFDCGEGTQRQFQKSNLSYMQITKVFITHFHGDHFLGLPGLIQTMQLNDREEPLEIYGPKGVGKLTQQLLSPQFVLLYGLSVLLLGSCIVSYTFSVLYQAL